MYQYDSAVDSSGGTRGRMGLVDRYVCARTALDSTASVRISHACRSLGFCTDLDWPLFHCRTVCTIRIREIRVGSKGRYPALPCLNCHRHRRHDHDKQRPVDPGRGAPSNIDQDRDLPKHSASGLHLAFLSCYRDSNRQNLVADDGSRILFPPARH